jgi:uncharacterized repeat protein (TIGR01451 family)/CSLREA domain-containing protein
VTNPTRAARRAALLVAGAALLAGVPPATAATTWTITKTADTNDGACTPSNCSLRDAVAQANLGSGDTVVVGAGDYVLTLGQLSMTSSMTISGAGAATTTIHASPGTRVFYKSGGDSTISGVTITGGSVSGIEPTGAGVENDIGDLVIRDSAVTGNSSASEAAMPQGAGIYNTTGNLTIDNSTISDNHANSATQSTTGGGIYDKATGATVTITRSRLTGNSSGNGWGGAFFTSANITIVISDSTFHDNHATGGGGALGGAIFDNSSTKTTISGSTFDANSASGGGGAIFGNAPLDITNSTFEGNAATGSLTVGGALFTNGAVTATNVTLDGNTTAGTHQTWQNNGTVTVVNSVIQTPSGDNCEQPLTSLGHNIENADTCGFHSAGDQPGTDPKLGQLADNGGPTFTELPALDSPALGTGLESKCPATDQRGIARPQDGVCDIGAVERSFAVDLGVTASVAPPIVRLKDRLTYTMKVTNSGPDTATGVQLLGTLPAGGTLVSTPPSCGSGLSCGLGSLVPGASATVTVVVQATDPGALPLSVRASGARPDSNPGNDSATVQAFAGPAAVSRLSISPRKFAPARKGATLSVHRGARIRFRLSRASRVRFVLQRLGKRKHYVSVRHGRIERRGKSGSNSVRFSARIRGRALKPGRYRMRLIPHDAGGTAKPKSVSFRIVRGQGRPR